MRFSSIQNTFFFGLLTLSTLAVLFVAHNFIQPIFWAVITGIVFYPLYRHLQALFKNNTAASLLSILIILIVVILPLYTLSLLVAHEAFDAYKNITQSKGSAQILTQIHALDKPLQAIGIDTARLHTDLSDIAKMSISYIGKEAVNFGRNAAHFFLQFFVVLYLLFFIFKDGTHATKRIREILPLGDAREQIIFTQFVSITRAIFKGTVIIALLQGIIGGVLFYLVGIHATLLWTVLMILLALIPAVGPSLLLVPTGILFIINHSLWQGALLIAGAVVISVIDNVLRPMLVGKDVQLHDAVITIAMLGGMSVFGFSGLIIGPLVTGFFFTMWQLFEQDYKLELKKRG